MSHDIWVKDGHVYIENNENGKSSVAHAPTGEVKEAIEDVAMGRLDVVYDECPICGRTDGVPHEHEIEGPGDTGIETPIDLDKGPKFGSRMKAGHYSITLGHEPDASVLFETDREQQAKLIHMALANAQTDQGLLETLYSCVNQYMQQKVYGSYGNPPIGHKPHTVVWLPSTDLPKIRRVLEEKGEHGLAALLRQGEVKWDGPKEKL